MGGRVTQRHDGCHEDQALPAVSLRTGLEKLSIPSFSVTPARSLSGADLHTALGLTPSSTMLPSMQLMCVEPGAAYLAALTKGIELAEAALSTAKEAQRGPYAELVQQEQALDAEVAALAVHIDEDWGAEAAALAEQRKSSRGRCSRPASAACSSRAVPTAAHGAAECAAAPTHEVADCATSR
jgi:hypothetical protein